PPPLGRQRSPAARRSVTVPFVVLAEPRRRRNVAVVVFERSGRDVAAQVYGGVVEGVVSRDHDAGAAADPDAGVGGARQYTRGEAVAEGAIVVDHGPGSVAHVA